VLIVSVMDRAPGVRPSHVSAFVGHLSGDRFEVDHAQQLGMGPDFYAPATTVTPDGRRLLIGWIPEDPPPPTSNRDWAGALTFPRVVSVDTAGRVDLRLAEEVASLRGGHTRTGPHLLRAGASAWRWELPEQDFEVLMDVDPGTASEIVIELIDGDASSPEVRIIFRPIERWLSVERRGIVSVAGRSSQGAAILPDGDGVGALSLRAIVDGSVMELEANGRTTATVRLPTSQGTRQQIALAATGGRARLVSLDAWQLERSRRTDPARYEGREAARAATAADR
jgi:beta-fructofuranosidase